MESKKIGELKKVLKDIKSSAKKDEAVERIYAEKVASRKFERREEHPWTVYNDDTYGFEEAFLRTLPEEYLSLPAGKRLTGYVESVLSQSVNKTQLKAVEFGGPGSRLFQGFKGFFSQTVGVCLVDMRQDFSVEQDQSLNHSVIEGNIFDFKKSGTYAKLAETLDHTGVDFIISRMQGGLDHIEIKEPILMDRLIREWYEMLNDNGIMLIQFENLIHELDSWNPPRGSLTLKRIVEWAKKISEKIPSVEIKFEERISGVQFLRLHKLAGAPKELPSAKELFRDA